MVRRGNVVDTRLRLARESIVVQLAAVVKVGPIETIDAKGHFVLGEAPRHWGSKLRFASQKVEEEGQGAAEHRAHRSKLRFQMRLEVNQLGTVETQPGHVDA
jgi:hypothetical protein